MNNEEDAAILEAQRAKCGFWFTEDVAPGLRIETRLEKILVSEKSDFQLVQVIESYFGRTLITDGKTQSAQMDEAAYHESLVHPAMLQSCRLAAAATNDEQKKDDNKTSFGPKTVFIGGGGELATAREVLKYKSVERVIMVDIDAKVVEVCKTYLPEWGGTTVTQDERFELIIGDAYQWFFDNPNEIFDVMIMDISDPIEAGPGIMLYVKEFYQNIVSQRLHPNHGVFVTQAGVADSIPAPHFTQGQQDTSCYGPIQNTLKTVFNCVVPFATNVPSFGGDWGFVLAFHKRDGETTGTKTPQEWMKSTMLPEPDLIDSLIDTHLKGGADSLKFYDQISHTRIFHLTKPLRASLKTDDRIMTKDNPIFMY